MRSSAFSNLAILATSLLIRDALGAPLENRGDVYKTVVATRIETVVRQADGSLETAAPHVLQGAPVVAPKPTPAAELQQTAKVAEPEEPIDTPAASTPVASTGDSKPSSGSKLPRKRGLPYNSASLLQGFTGSGSKASWCYNWDSKPGQIPSGLNYSPMLHGLDSDHLGPWVANANAAITAGATHLQYINEPDMEKEVGGVNTSPQAAAAGYVANMMPFKGKAKIGSPAVSSAGPGGPQGVRGIGYLKEFFSKCGNCHFDFVPFHWYGEDPEQFKQHVQDVRDAVKGVSGVAKDSNGNPTLWITEFGLNNGNPESISAFLKKVMPWLDSQDYIERYAYQWVVSNHFLLIQKRKH